MEEERMRFHHKAPALLSLVTAVGLEHFYRLPGREITLVVTDVYFATSGMLLHLYEAVCWMLRRLGVE